MNLHHPVTDEARGQATYGMANLRMERTGLPFIVFISQRDGARHDVRVKTSPAPHARLDQMSSYALRPFRLAEGMRLSGPDETKLRRWTELNLDVLVDYWDGAIEFTEDALDRLRKL